MFEVILSPEAQDFYAAADHPVARKLARCFGQLEREPRRHNNIKMLAGDWLASDATASAIGGSSTRSMMNVRS